MLLLRPPSPTPIYLAVKNIILELVLKSVLAGEPVPIVSQQHNLNICIEPQMSRQG